MLFATKASDVGSVQGMFLYERNGFVHSGDEVRTDLGTIDDVASVDTLEPSDLYPRVRKPLFPLPTEQQQSAHCGDASALMARHESKRQ
jgi:hypothetical protein